MLSPDIAPTYSSPEIPPSLSWPFLARQSHAIFGSQQVFGLTSSVSIRVPKQSSDHNQDSNMPPRKMPPNLEFGDLVVRSSPTKKRYYTAEDLTSEDSAKPCESLAPNERYQLDKSDRVANVDPAGRLLKRSKPVKSACGQCQRRKTKCSGQRPVCGFCSDRDLQCSWDIGDGLTRNAELRQRLAKANSHSADINILVNDMRTNTDAIATMLLAKLRLGESVADLAIGIRAGTSFTANKIYTPEEAPSLQNEEIRAIMDGGFAISKHDQMNSEAEQPA